MKKILAYFLSFLLVQASCFLSAQETKAPPTNKIIDSLVQVLKALTPSSPELKPAIEGESAGIAIDTAKINTLNSLSREYINIGSYDQALRYAQHAQQKAENLIDLYEDRKENFALKTGIADAYKNIGVIYRRQGNYEKGMSNYLNSLKMYEEIGNKKGVANCYNNIGVIYWNQGNYGKALAYQLKSLKIREAIGDKDGMASNYNNIGLLYYEQGNYESALKFYLNGLKIIEFSSGKESLKANLINNSGLVYFKWGNFLKALDYYFEALKIREELGDMDGITEAYTNIGEVYFKLADSDSTKRNANNSYKKALGYYFKSLKINLKIGKIQGEAVNYNHIGILYLKQNKLIESYEYAIKSLTLCKQIGYKEGIKEAYSTLSELHEKKGDYKQAFKYKKLFLEIKDTLLNEKSSKQLAEMNSRYDSENKDKEIQLLNKEKEIQVSLAAIDHRKQQVILFSVSGFSLLLMVLALFIYRSYRQKQYLNMELEKLSIVASETDNGVLICGANGELEWCNAGLTRLSGYSLEEIKQKGNTLEEVSNSPEIKSIIHKSIKNKKSSVYQELIITKDGNERWMQSTFTPILDEKGNITNLVVIDTDVSERKKIEEKLSEQNIELEKSHKNISILSEIGREITTSLSIEKIIEKTYENINKLMDADVFSIGIHNKINNTIDFPGLIENGKKYNSSCDLNDDTRFPVICFKQRQGILINDVFKEYKNYISYLPEPIVGGSPESIIYLPLISKEKIIGVITVQSFQKNVYTTYHLDILKNLAVYVAIAIENAQLYEHLEEKVKERTFELLKKNEEIEKTYNNIKVLSEIGQEITSTLDIEKGLETVYKKVNSLMDATEFGIGIYSQEEQTIDLSYYVYESKIIGSIGLGTQVSMNEKNRLSIWCAENKKAVFINDIQFEYSRYIPNLDAYKGEGKLLLESVICLPLLVEEKLVGIISVQSPRKNAYKQSDLEILQTLASYVAIALANARLYDNMEGEVKIRTVEIEKQKELIEKKNLKIIDSITYARLIQQSILMEESEIQFFLPECFIYYLPKDIVSGDFYWFSKVNEVIILAAIDCTGHGVPGAFMSMIGNTLLNRIVNEKRNTQPSEILRLLNLGIYEALHQQKDGVLSHDGLDIAVCRIDSKNAEMQYAGAQNPLYMIWDGNLEVIKADMHTIGGGGNMETGFDPLLRTYTNHTFPIKKGMSIYLFSDGYMDQFGGHDRKKFGIPQFKDLLLNNQHLSMSQQKEKIAASFDDWKGDTPQLDDVLVIGLRL